MLLFTWWRRNLKMGLQRENRDQLSFPELPTKFNKEKERFKQDKG